MIIRDEELYVEKLRDIIRELMGGSQKLKTMRQAYSRVQVLDAAGLLANEVLNLN
jgi:UDP-N-acetylglucosamine:LPS N-acetylglucosamine transferase